MSETTEESRTDCECNDASRRPTVIDSEYLMRRPWLTVRRDRLRLPDGRINPEFYVLEYPDWVNVLATTEQGDFVMVRQYRHGLGRTLTELAAGVIEQGETPEQAARRELLEETGYGEGRWHEMMVISGNPSTTNNLTHCFVAEGVRCVSAEQHLDATEDVCPVVLTEAQVREMLMADQMKQALMAAPLWRYFWLKDTHSNQ